MIDITLFTPTYNRARTLHRVRESLLRQTLDPARFEWVIVDDGSSDGTRELVESWRDDPFAIRYFWQANAGKHVAWNRAVAAARGPLFTCLDSDDACVAHALERFVTLWASVSAERRRDLAGILVRCQEADGTPVGPAFPKCDTADFVELVLLHAVNRDTWTALQTEILRANPFPELRVPLLPESVLWHRLARHRLWLLRDECLHIRYSGEQGRADQLSRVSAFRFPAGMALMHRSLLDNSWRFRWNVPGQFVRASLHFDRFTLHAGLPVGGQIQELEQPGARALCWALLPAAYVLYKLDAYRHLRPAAPPQTSPG
jgi:glycosyltransferase involved in cell wall biosynthesis